MLTPTFGAEEAGRALKEFGEYAEDVLRSDGSSFLPNLKQLVHLQRDNPLFAHVFADGLKIVNFDRWLGGMRSRSDGGNGVLQWPADRREKLYLQTILLTQIADGKIDFLDFMCEFMTTGESPDKDVARFNQQICRPYFRDYSNLADDIAQRLAAPAPPSPAIQPQAVPDLFISHSSKDSDLAEAVIGLLRTALNISHEKIRCSSVAGYKLAAGAETDATIRNEVLKSKVLVGLLTPASLNSTYVLFELGARWGPGLRLVPLLAKGATPGFLRGPISGFNALRAGSEEDLHQFLGDIGKELKLTLANASVYNRQLKAVVTVCQSGDVFSKFDHRRVKGRGELKRDQYFVYQRQVHYLDPGAAAVCDRAGVFCQDVEPEDEALLVAAIGEPFNAAQVEAIFRAQRVTVPGEPAVEAVRLPRRDRTGGLL